MSVSSVQSLLSVHLKAIKLGIIGTSDEIGIQEQGNRLSQGSLLTEPEAGPVKG